MKQALSWTVKHSDPVFYGPLARGGGGRGSELMKKKEGYKREDHVDHMVTTNARLLWQSGLL